jgi:hypothetical protein
MISRVGAEKDIKVDVRVMLLRIKDLKTEIAGRCEIYIIDRTFDKGTFIK